MLLVGRWLHGGQAVSRDLCGVPHLDCTKITYNCVMTLASFLFSAIECRLLREMTEDNEHEQQENKINTAVVKMLELVLELAFAYIIFDAATTEPPGVGTTELVVVACLAEVLLVSFKCCTSFCLSAAASLDTDGGLCCYAGCKAELKKPIRCARCTAAVYCCKGC